MRDLVEDWIHSMESWNGLKGFLYLREDTPEGESRCALGHLAELLVELGVAIRRLARPEELNDQTARPWCYRMKDEDDKYASCAGLSRGMAAYVGMNPLGQKLRKYEISSSVPSISSLSDNNAGYGAVIKALREHPEVYISGLGR